MDDEYVVIAEERIKAHKPDKQQHDFFQGIKWQQIDYQIMVICFR